MKFKKEDIGLYFALGLVGAGVGLLVGAFIASRREGPIPVGVLDSVQDWHKEEVGKKPPEKKLVKKSKKESTPELDAFIEKYQPTAIQIEMVKNGLFDLESLEKTLIQEELAKQKEPYNYNGPYLDDDKPDLSDLADLPEDEEIVDDRYKILQKPPKKKSTKNMRVIYFDQGDNSFYTMTRQKQPVPVGSINEFVSEETWEVMLPYMLSGFAPLYVNDLTNAKYYRFELVPEDMEDPSEDNEFNQ